MRKVRPRAGEVFALTSARGAFVIQEYPVPGVRSSAILVRMELAGTCATDAYGDEVHWPNLRFPVVPGHENVGIVEAIGAGVDHDSLGATSTTHWVRTFRVPNARSLPFRELVSHHIPLGRTDKAIHRLLAAAYVAVDKTSTIAIASYGLDVTNDGGSDDANSGV